MMWLGRKQLANGRIIHYLEDDRTGKIKTLAIAKNPEESIKQSKIIHNIMGSSLYKEDNRHWNKIIDKELKYKLKSMKP